VTCCKSFKPLTTAQMPNPVVNSGWGQCTLVRIYECSTHHCKVIPVRHNENHIKEA